MWKHFTWQCWQGSGSPQMIMIPWQGIIPDGSIKWQNSLVGISDGNDFKDSPQMQQARWQRSSAEISDGNDSKIADSFRWQDKQCVNAALLTSQMVMIPRLRIFSDGSIRWQSSSAGISDDNDSPSMAMLTMQCGKAAHLCKKSFLPQFCLSI